MVYHTLSVWISRKMFSSLRSYDRSVKNINFRSQKSETMQVVSNIFIKRNSM